MFRSFFSNRPTPKLNISDDDSSHSSDESNVLPDHPVSHTSLPDPVNVHSVHLDSSDARLPDIDPITPSDDACVHVVATTPPMDLSFGSNGTSKVTSESTSYNGVEQTIPVIPKPSSCTPSQTDIASSDKDIKDNTDAYIAHNLSNAVDILERENKPTTEQEVKPIEDRPSVNLDATNLLSQGKPNLDKCSDMVQGQEMIAASCRPKTSSCPPLQMELSMDAGFDKAIAAYVTGIISNAIDILEKEKEVASSGPTLTPDLYKPPILTKPNLSNYLDTTQAIEMERKPNSSSLSLSSLNTDIASSDMKERVASYISGIISNAVSILEGEKDSMLREEAPAGSTIAKPDTDNSLIEMTPKLSNGSVIIEGSDMMATSSLLESKTTVPSKDSVAVYIKGIIANAVDILEGESKPTTEQEVKAIKDPPSINLDATSRLSQGQPDLDKCSDMVQAQGMIAASCRPKTSSCPPLQMELNMDAGSDNDIAAYVTGIISNAIDILEKEKEVTDSGPNSTPDLYKPPILSKPNLSNYLDTTQAIEMETKPSSSSLSLSSLNTDMASSVMKESVASYMSGIISNAVSILEGEKDSMFPEEATAGSTIAKPDTDNSLIHMTPKLSNGSVIIEGSDMMATSSLLEFKTTVPSKDSVAGYIRGIIANAVDILEGENNPTTEQEVKPIKDRPSVNLDATNRPPVEMEMNIDAASDNGIAAYVTGIISNAINILETENEPGSEKEVTGSGPTSTPDLDKPPILTKPNLSNYLDTTQAIGMETKPSSSSLSLSSLNTDIASSNMKDSVASYSSGIISNAFSILEGERGSMVPEEATAGSPIAKPDAGNSLIQMTPKLSSLDATNPLSQGKPNLDKCSDMVQAQEMIAASCLLQTSPCRPVQMELNMDAGSDNKAITAYVTGIISNAIDLPETEKVTDSVQISTPDPYKPPILTKPKLVNYLDAAQAPEMNAAPCPPSRRLSSLNTDTHSNDMKDSVASYSSGIISNAFSIPEGEKDSMVKEEATAGSLISKPDAGNSLIQMTPKLSNGSVIIEGSDMMATRTLMASKTTVPSKDSVAGYVRGIIANAVDILEGESKPITEQEVKPIKDPPSINLDATNPLCRGMPDLDKCSDMVQVQEMIAASCRPKTSSCPPLQMELNMDAGSDNDIAAYVNGIISNAIDILETEKEVTDSGPTSNPYRYKPPILTKPKLVNYLDTAQAPEMNATPSPPSRSLSSLNTDIASSDMKDSVGSNISGLISNAVSIVEGEKDSMVKEEATAGSLISKPDTGNSVIHMTPKLSSGSVIIEGLDMWTMESETTVPSKDSVTGYIRGILANAASEATSILNIGHRLTHVKPEVRNASALVYPREVVKATNSEKNSSVTFSQSKDVAKRSYMGNIGGYFSGIISSSLGFLGVEKKNDISTKEVTQTATYTKLCAPPQKHPKDVSVDAKSAVTLRDKKTTHLNASSSEKVRREATVSYIPRSSYAASSTYQSPESSATMDQASSEITPGPSTLMGSAKVGIFKTEKPPEPLSPSTPKNSMDMTKTVGQCSSPSPGETGLNPLSLQSPSARESAGAGGSANVVSWQKELTPSSPVMPASAGSAMLVQTHHIPGGRPTNG